MLSGWWSQGWSIRCRVVGHYMMKAPTYKDADYLSHEPRTLGRFADLKADLFPNSPLHSITPAINTCAVRFPDENIATNSCLSIDTNRNALHEDRLQGDRWRLLCFARSLDMQAPVAGRSCHTRIFLTECPLERVTSYYVFWSTFSSDF